MSPRISPPGKSPGPVSIGATPAAFIAAVEAALRESTDERKQRLIRSRALLNDHNWDGIAARMWSLLCRTPRMRQPSLDDTALPSRLIPGVPATTTAVSLTPSD